MKLYIWLVFVIIFAFLAGYHFYQAKQNIRHIENKGMIKTINTAKVGLVEFIDDFNRYIDVLNKSNKTSNIIAGIGYVAASLTAILSFCISL